MKKTLTIVIAITLAMAAASGCSAKTDTVTTTANNENSTSVTSAVTTANTTAADSTTNGTSASADSFTKDEFIAVLDKCCSDGVDTAGGSLKAAAAAAGLVEFSAKYATDDRLETISADMDEWYKSISEDEKVTLKANWDTIYKDAQSIISNPADMTDLLQDAGVTTDFSNMDLTTGISVCNMLDSLMKG